MDYFYYFICLESNKDLLKEEIKLFAPALKPSFSKGRFLTYKSSKKIVHNFCFALAWGLNDSIDATDIENKIKATEMDTILPELAPSRAYLKIAEACKIFKIDDPKYNWVEFGCAPGGASYYLLNHFNHLIGVDPAEVDDIVKKNPNFYFIQKPIQNLTRSDFEFYHIDYITSDLNLNPFQAIEEVLKCSEYFVGLRGIFMTIKMVKLEHVKRIPQFKSFFRQAGYKKIYTLQLPSHKREFLLFASRH